MPRNWQQSHFTGEFAEVLSQDNQNDGWALQVGKCCQPSLYFVYLEFCLIFYTVPLLLVTKAPRRMLNLSVRPAIYHIWHSNVGKMHFYLFTLPTKVHRVKAMVFPVVMFGCESWTMKKAEHRRIDAFELWCWRRLLRVPWTARRSNQSILKVTSCLANGFFTSEPLGKPPPE